MIVVIMGVAGAGKTTVGRLLAAYLGFEFAEGDAFHPPANIEKMRRKEALGDSDRWPWLDRLAAQIARWSEERRDVVLTCSALKRAYRRRLIAGRDGVRLVFLNGDPALIDARLKSRQGHFMPPDLLASQFETLELPRPAEAPIVAEVTDPPDAIVLTIARALGHVESQGHGAEASITRDGNS